MKQIVLSNKDVALVDDQDYEELSRRSWYISSSGYACTWLYGKNARMHRMIMKAESGLDVDHINHNKLDNRRSNLRLCTRSQNNANRITTSSTGYKGVTWIKKKNRFAAQIKINGVNKYLGLFKSAVDAAKAYDVAAKKLFGDFAKVNF